MIPLLAFYGAVTKVQRILLNALVVEKTGAGKAIGYESMEESVVL